MAAKKPATKRKFLCCIRHRITKPFPKQKLFVVSLIEGDIQATTGISEQFNEEGLLRMITVT